MGLPLKPTYGTWPHYAGGSCTMYTGFSLDTLPYYMDLPYIATQICHATEYEVGRYSVPSTSGYIWHTELNIYPPPLVFLIKIILCFKKSSKFLDYFQLKINRSVKLSATVSKAGISVLFLSKQLFSYFSPSIFWEIA